MFLRKNNYQTNRIKSTKNILLILILSCQSFACFGQLIRNFGNIEIHNNAHLGFYSSIQNDGLLSGNTGLVGFYGNKLLSLSGSYSPNLSDMEVANENGLFLDVPILVNNNMNYIYGNIITDKNNLGTFLELTAMADYQGQSDFSKVDGFAQSTVNNNYLFPVGDEFYLRPLAVSAVPENSILKCAYFFGNALVMYNHNNSSENNILAITTNEFWKLEGDLSATVTIGWDSRSSLIAMTSDTQDLTVVGYHKETEAWVDLGSVDTTGSLDEGFITSDTFIPSEYEALTFGSVIRTNPLLHKEHHYLVTPNDDGINDYLFIPELEAYESNEIQIFDRNGLKVFEKENYSTEFIGQTSQHIFTVDRNAGLPQGVYFYLLHLNDKQFTLQGFLYLQR